MRKNVDIDTSPGGNPINAVIEVPAVLTSKGKKGRGRQNRRNRQKLREDSAQPSKLREWWNATWTVLDNDNNPTEPLGDLQLEIDTCEAHIHLPIRGGDTLMLPG